MTPTQAQIEAALNAYYRRNAKDWTPKECDQMRAALTAAARISNINPCTGPDAAWGPEIDKLIAVEREACARMEKQLREKHFALPTTDMVGDDDRNRGYLEGLRDYAAAIRARKDDEK